MIPSAATTRAGYAVSGVRGSFGSLGALGLRLKMRGGHEAITTVTHGFVNKTEREPILLTVTNWLLRAKEAITRFLISKPSETLPAQVTMREQATVNSPLGKEIWIAGTDQRVSYVRRPPEEYQALTLVLVWHHPVYVRYAQPISPIHCRLSTRPVSDQRPRHTLAEQGLHR